MKQELLELIIKQQGETIKELEQRLNTIEDIEIKRKLKSELFNNNIKDMIQKDKAVTLLKETK